MIALVHLAQSPPLFQPLGVCRIDDRGASCWSVDGRPDPELTGKVDRLARENRDWTFVHGRKNRFLITRQSSVNSLSATSASGRVMTYSLDSEPGENLMVFRVDSSLDVKTATVVAKALVTDGQPAEVAFRKGAKAQVEDVRLTLSQIVSGAGRMPFGPMGGYGWRFAVERNETSPPGGLAFEAIGRDGKPISYVDALGRPYDQKKGEAIWRQVAAGKWDWRTPPEAEVAQFWPDFEQPSVWFSTNVDPKSVSGLRVRRLVERNETLGPFALDPVQPSVP